MSRPTQIVFVCEHGAAKSIIAATLFNKLAKEKNLDLSSIARGTHPDSELSPKTISGLREEGLAPSEPSPQKLSLADLDHAELIVSFCELPEEFHNQITTEQWNDIPPVSENYAIARDAILSRLQRLPQFSNL
jgi:arsenate reductase (thioredoxin)